MVKLMRFAGLQMDLHQPLCAAMSSAGGGMVDRVAVVAGGEDRTDGKGCAEAEDREEGDAWGELEDEAGMK